MFGAGIGRRSILIDFDQLGIQDSKSTSTTYVFRGLRDYLVILVPA
jgi:hypothetical protein